MPRHRIVLAALAVAAPLGAAQAQTHPLGASLGKMDTDGDSRVSTAEWLAERLGGTHRWDRDQDQSLTRDEVGAHYAAAAPLEDPRTQRRIEAVMRADANGDGAVSRDEHRASETAEFQRRDVTGDGFISVDDRR